MEFDDVLECVGEAMAMNFIGGKQEHWCKVPELQRLSFRRQKLIAIPNGSSKSAYVQCKTFPLNYSSYSISDFLQWNETDRQKVEATFPNVNSYSEWRFFGAISAGAISDKWGRKPAIVIFIIIKLIGGYLATFASNLILFCFGRFIMAIGTTGSGIAAYVLMQEIIDKKYRAMVGMTWTSFFSLGFALLPGIAYLIRDHRAFQFVYITPALIMLSYVFLLDESPRWLVSQGKVDKAEKILKRIAIINGRNPPQKITFDNKNNEQRQGKLVDLFRTPNIRKKTIIVSLLWFTCSLMYYGLSLNTGQLAGNIFLNTFLSAFIEIPSKLSAPTGYRTAVAIISKSGVSIAFGSTYIYSIELFPTGVRNVGLGWGSMIARISGVASPYVGGPLSNVWKPLPTTIFGLFATLSGLFTFLLPETLNRKLPETIEEGENFGK
ncbi:DgyrCDS3769 [Dimorphilus gyrociliatus]|uniref:DgyrCDS3769 n=1 Tax=Dimorphilus gyrociliatus TaxID=2664684 RepID=A0A7I8VEY1_9ANNE|nr:DgyrCDS3769 [Dimorphilus gyrociliatus]